MSVFQPLHALEREAHHLHELEQLGEAPETPLLAMLGLAAFLLPVAALMMLLAFGAAWLFGASGLSAF